MVYFEKFVLLTKLIFLWNSLQDDSKPKNWLNCCEP